MVIGTDTPRIKPQDGDLRPLPDGTTQIFRNGKWRQIEFNMAVERKKAYARHQRQVHWMQNGMWYCFGIATACFIAWLFQFILGQHAPFN
jgi:hypothetical protein